MLKTSVLIFLLLFSGNAYAGCPKGQPEDAGYRYFCGIGTGGTKTQALERARQNGEVQARKIFGDVGGFSYTKSNGERVSAADSYSEKDSDIRALENIDENAECHNGICEAYAFFRFSKKEIALEMERLKSRKQNKRKNLTGVSSAESGILNLTTLPVSNADVYIDGVKISEGNSDIRSYVKKGVRKLTIDHPNYELYETKIKIAAGNADTPHSVVLKPASVRMQIVVENKDVSAEIHVNGMLTGRTPDKVDLFIDRENTVVLKHPEMYDYTLNFIPKDMERGYHDVKRIRMQEKPAYISISSKPDGAEVFLDGEYAGLTPMKKEVSRGTHQYRVSKEGFSSRSSKIDAVGGETKSEMVWLEKSDSGFDKIAPTVSAMKKKEKAFYGALETTDKYHRYVFNPLPETKPVFPRGANREERVVALMQWNYLDNIVRASASYKASGRDTVIFVKIFLDDDLYRENVFPVFMDALKPLTESSGSEKIAFRCERKGKDADRLTAKCDIAGAPDSVNLNWNIGTYDANNFLIKYDQTVGSFNNKIFVRRQIDDEPSAKVNAIDAKLVANPLFEKVRKEIKRKIYVLVTLKDKREFIRFIPFRIQKFYRENDLVQKADQSFPKKVRNAFNQLIAKRNRNNPGVMFFPRLENSLQAVLKQVVLKGVDAEEIRSVELTYKEVIEL